MAQMSWLWGVLLPFLGYPLYDCVNWETALERARRSG